MKTDTVKTTSTDSKTAPTGKLVKGTKKQQAPRPCLPVYMG